MARSETIVLGSLAGLAAFLAADHVVRKRAPARNVPERLPPRFAPSLVKPTAEQIVAQSDFRPAIDKIEAVDDLGSLLERCFEMSPTCGHFYEVQPRDTPETVSKAALSKIVGKPSRKQVLDYIYCFSSCRYNMSRYGSRSTSLSFPSKWTVPGLGIGLRAAFRPCNADAIDLMGQGLPVPRTVDDQARPTSPECTSLGTIWLSAVRADRLSEDGVVTCEGMSYSCGTSQLEPDPALLRMLEAS